MDKIFLLLITFFLVSCKPDLFEIDLYTSDLDVALEGEIVLVNIKATFEMLGDDDDGDLDRAITIAKKYLSPETTYVQSQGMMGPRMIIETRIPLGSLDSVNTYLTNQPAIAVLTLEEDRINLLTTTKMDALDRELSGMNFMLGFDWPPKSTSFNVISDSREKKNVSATAVFVKNKGMLYFDQVLNRRDSVKVVFSGESGSVYSDDIQPHLYIK
jgi:hypothetical protein